MKPKNVIPLHEGVQLTAGIEPHELEADATDPTRILRRYLSVHEGVEVAQDADDPMKILKEVLSRMAAREPQKLELPRSPTADELRDARRRAGLSKQQAAELCDTHRTTWARWECGSQKMPRAVWGWFRAATSGVDLAGGGKDWEQWCFWKGALCSPEGLEFTPGQIRSLPVLWQRIRAMEAQIRKLTDDLGHADALNVRMSRNYYSAKAMGQLEALSRAMYSVLRMLGQGEDGMPPVMPGIDQLLIPTMEPVYRLQMELVKRMESKPDRDA